VKVVVEDLSSDIEQAGLTVKQLQTDVELRLRLAGIHVLTAEERLSTPGKPFLYVNVNIVLGFASRGAYSIHVELNQQVSLTTDGSLATGATWSTGIIGTVDRVRLDSVRNKVRDRVDAFINAYLSVHPRSPGKVKPSSTFPRRDCAR